MLHDFLRYGLGMWADFLAFFAWWQYQTNLGSYLTSIALDDGATAVFALHYIAEGVVHAVTFDFSIVGASTSFLWIS